MSMDRSSDGPNAVVFAEASEWLIELREGGLDAEGHSRFHAWLRRSPEHIRAYLEVAALWGDIPKLAAGMQVDVDAVVQRARALSNVAPLQGARAAAFSVDTSPGTQATVLARLMERPRRWAVAAAVAVICIAAGASWLWLQPNTYETGIGEQRSITLADGSTIDLGARSQVRVRLSPQERDVELVAGEALFTVAKDPERPFVVSTGPTFVRAVGTQFDVHKEVSGVTVMVLEGRVAILTEHHLQTLRPLPAAAAPEKGSGSADPAQLVPHLYVSAGEQVTVSLTPEPSQSVGGGTHLPSVRPIPAGASAALGQRTLSFEDTSLLDVIEEFNRYNRQQLTLADPALGALRISGVFAAAEPASLLRFLTQEMHLNVDNNGHQVLISSDGKKNISEQ